MKKRFLIPVIMIFLLTVFMIYKVYFMERNYNVIIFTLDTTRADYIDTGQGAKAKTPVLKNIAKNSIVCKNAYTVIPITMPSHTSIFTGRLPYETGVFNNGENYEKQLPTLAEIFKKKGYETGAVISLGVLLKEHKLNKGFDYYSDDFSSAFPSYFLNAETITKRGLSLLKKFKTKKFFLWLHYSDPHEPYAPPYLKRMIHIWLNQKLIAIFNLYNVTPMTVKLDLNKGKNTIFLTRLKYLRGFLAYPLKIKDLKILAKEDTIKLNFYNTKIYNDKKLLLLNNKSYIEIFSPKKQTVTISFNMGPNLIESFKTKLYRKEVEYMDYKIGEIIGFLKKNKLYKKTVLIFVGDHGEGLGEYRGNFGHIHFLRPQYIKVPLFLKLPSKKSMIVNNLVSTIDIAPTLLKYMRFKTKHLNFSGINIFKINSKRTIFSYTYRPESFFNGVSIIHNNFQFIKYKGAKSFEEFLDLNKSKGYVLSDNIINNVRYLNIIKKMKKTAILKLRKSKRRSQTGNFSEETKKILKSLGYL